jgi:hypothetical protein
MIYALRARNAAVLAEERAKVAWDEAESSKQQLNDYAKQIESVLSKMPAFVRSAVTPPAITPATATSGVHAAAAAVRPSRRPSPEVPGSAKPPAKNRPASGAERPSSAQVQVPAAQPVPPRDLPVQTAQPTAPVAASSPPDARESAAPELRRSAPRTPVTLSVHNRSITYSKVSLNFQGNAITVSPGQVFTVSFHWEVRVPAAPECPGCYVQYYYGIGGKAGGESRCFVSDIMGPNSSKSGDVKGTLQAPRAEGLYFITQGTTWEYSCQEKKVSQSAHPGDAIAVILVR